MFLLRGTLSAVPPRMASRLGAGLGWFLYAVVRLRRARTEATLAAAFGDTLPPGERRRILARCYRHFGALIAEFLVEPRIAGPRLTDYIVLDNPGLVREALAQGRGVIVALGHLGNWELLGVGLAQDGISTTAYVGRQHNPIADTVVNELRRHLGVNVINPQNGMRGMLRALKGGHALLLASDQHFSRNRYFVRFFGRPVSAAPGLASLLRHTGAPVLFAETVRVGRFRYRAHFAPFPVPEPVEDTELDVLRIMQRFFDVLEQAVRRHPEQYFWMHKRWRTPPADEALSPVNRAFLAEGVGVPTPPPELAPPPTADPEAPAARPE